MSRNRTIGFDNLSNAARAAGFAMATPDDRPEDIPVQHTPEITATKSNWTSAAPNRSMIVAAPRSAGLQSTLRDWFASIGWRAPA